MTGPRALPFIFSILLHLAILLGAASYLHSIHESTVFKNFPILSINVVPSSPNLNLNTTLPKPVSIQTPSTPAALGTPAALVPIPRPNEISDYFQSVRKEIEAHLQYPISLQERRLEGLVVLELDVESSGHLKSARFIQSSGHRELDELAVKAALKASPFKPFPGSNNRSAHLPIRFKSKR